MANPVKYSSTEKWLHWLVALIVGLMLTAGWGMEDMPISDREAIIMGHSGLGLTVLLLMIFRCIRRLTHEQPALPDSVSPAQKMAARGMQWALYGLLLLQPLLGVFQAMFVDYQVTAFGILDISGLAASQESTAEIFHQLHGLNALLLIILSLGHIGAAIYHHVVKKDNVLRTMIPFGKVE